MRNIAELDRQIVLAEDFSGFDPKQLLDGNLREYILWYLIVRGLATQENACHIHQSPLKHEGSQALYYADYYLREHRILFGVMPPDSKSTKHYHEEPLVEEYHPLAGQLYLNGESIPPQGLLVRPYTTHQASTKEISAITLIVMRNAAKIPKHLQHVRVQTG